MFPNFCVAKNKSKSDVSGSHTKSKDDEQMIKEEYLKRGDVLQFSTICSNEKVQMLTAILLTRLKRLYICYRETSQPNAFSR